MSTMFDDKKLSRSAFLGIIGAAIAAFVLAQFSGLTRAFTTQRSVSAGYGSTPYGGKKS